MRGGNGLRRCSLSAIIRGAACFALASINEGAAPSAPPECLARLSGAKLEEQLLCLRELRDAGPAAAPAMPVLCDILIRSDGSTDHVLIASSLDVLRSMGHGAAPAVETLSSLLRHRNKLYTDRDKILVVRLRAYIIVTLSEIGFPSSALPALLDSIAHVDQRMTAVEAGAAARAVRSLGPRGHRFAPYLLEMLTERFSEEFSLERYEPEFPVEEATTAQLEALRALARVCSPEDQQALTAIRQLAEDRSGAQDPRVVWEAQRALELIDGANRPSSARGERQ
jgi:hypothetical protein